MALPAQPLVEDNRAGAEQAPRVSVLEAVMAADGGNRKRELERLASTRHVCSDWCRHVGYSVILKSRGATSPDPQEAFGRCISIHFSTLC